MFRDEVLVTESHPITPVPFVYKAFSENEVELDEKYGPVGSTVATKIDYNKVTYEYEFPYQNEEIKPEIIDSSTRSWSSKI